MRNNIYSIYDKQSEIYGRPFYAVNDILAKRTFETIANNPESDIHKYPQDYKLVKLGHFDTKSGHIEKEYEALT